MTTYIGLAFSMSMLPEGDVNLHKDDLSIEGVFSEVEQGAISCFNPSHQATIVALKEKHGITVGIPAVAPKISLKDNDSIIVLQVLGLPRLSDPRRESLNSPAEYTSEEIDGANFKFMKLSLL